MKVQVKYCRNVHKANADKMLQGGTNADADKMQQGAVAQAQIKCWSGGHNVDAYKIQPGGSSDVVSASLLK